MQVCASVPVSVCVRAHARERVCLNANRIIAFLSSCILLQINLFCFSSYHVLISSFALEYNVHRSNTK